MNLKLSISAPVVLFFIFLTLKLCGVIAWTWWWITSPLWLPTILLLLGLVAAYFIVWLAGKLTNLH